MKNKATHFITTIITLVMMLTVLSTATYAWYTVINRASGSSISFTASSNEGGGDLAIAWSPVNTTSFVLQFDEPIDTLYPMIPRNLPIVDATTRNDFTNGNFTSSNQTKNTLDEWICSVSGQDVSPLICTGDNGGVTQQHFYLINRSIYNMEVIVIYDITGTVLRDKLRVAMFVGTTPANMVLKGIMANNDAIHYGPIVGGQKVSEIPTMPGVFRDTTQLNFRMQPQEILTISLVAWLDGAIMTDEDAETSATFGVRFDGIAVE